MTVDNFLQICELSDFFSRSTKTQPPTPKILQVFKELSTHQFQRNLLWDSDSDKKLINFVERYGEKNWVKISLEFPQFDQNDCLLRYRNVLKISNKKGPWNLVEDDILRTSVNQLGINSWRYVSYLVPGRNPKQCRERWLNQLSPEINKGPFTKEEEELLIEKQSEFGNRWCVLSKFFKGRPENMLKNYWYSIISQKDNKQKRNQTIDSKTTPRTKKRSKKKTSKDVYVPSGSTRKRVQEEIKLMNKNPEILSSRVTRSQLAKKRKLIKNKNETKQNPKEEQMQERGKIQEEEEEEEEQNQMGEQQLKEDPKQESQTKINRINNTNPNNLRERIFTNQTNPKQQKPLIETFEDLSESRWISIDENQFKFDLEFQLNNFKKKLKKEKNQPLTLLNPLIENSNLFSKCNPNTPLFDTNNNFEPNFDDSLKTNDFFPMENIEESLIDAFQINSMSSDVNTKNNNKNNTISGNDNKENENYHINEKSKPLNEKIDKFGGYSLCDDLSSDNQIDDFQFGHEKDLWENYEENNTIEENNLLQPLSVKNPFDDSSDIYD
ncbi:snRNA-activating protein complex subunit [Anaeramoeba flamelloides]|uniref:snRNA-activating protein complex subunit n=1 Tax=Anaeramoeba flamelloides TaxID=1746091 RepID=A0AAV7YBQ6_9EUKA|nr:snRNA-activating protein complex subunit [Anaeramoeba flamelloides]